MDCTEAGAGFRDWARGAAPLLPKEAQAHVDSCAGCAAAWQRERNLAAALESLRLEDARTCASPATRNRVLEALPAPPAPAWSRWRPGLALAAVLVIAVFGGWYASRKNQAVSPTRLPVLYTDFFPLSAVALDRHEPANIVRIRLPRREMRRFGLPVSEELERSPVEADVLIGQDGIARAVRFVSTGK